MVININGKVIPLAIHYFLGNNHWLYWVIQIWAIKQDINVEGFKHHFIILAFLLGPCTEIGNSFFFFGTLLSEMPKKLLLILFLIK